MKSSALAKDELTKLEREKRGKGYVDEGATPKSVPARPAGKGKTGAKARTWPTGKPIIFEDTNLALAILDACIDAGLLVRRDAGVAVRTFLWRRSVRRDPARVAQDLIHRPDAGSRRPRSELEDEREQDPKDPSALKET